MCASVQDAGRAGSGRLAVGKGNATRHAGEPDDSGVAAEDLGFSSGTGALRRGVAMRPVVDLGAGGVCGIPGSNRRRRVGVLLHGNGSPMAYCRTPLIDSEESWEWRPIYG